jgi:hypothetical protein
VSSAKYEIVGPEEASSYLEASAPNRSIRPQAVRNMTLAMVAGNFQDRGDPIRFDKNGFLVDGQHRLMAIVESGIPQRLLVIRGLDPEMIQFIDQDRSARTPADSLRLLGAPNVNALAGALTLTLKKERGIKLTQSFKAALLDLLDLYASNREVWDAAASRGQALSKLVKGLGPTVAAFLFYQGWTEPNERLLILLDDPSALAKVLAPYATLTGSDKARGIIIEEIHKASRSRDYLSKRNQAA